MRRQFWPQPVRQILDEEEGDRGIDRGPRSGSRSRLRPSANRISARIALRRENSQSGSGTSRVRPFELVGLARTQAAAAAATRAPQPDPCHASHQPSASSARPAAGQSSRCSRPLGGQRPKAQASQAVVATRSSGVETTSIATAGHNHPRVNAKAAPRVRTSAPEHQPVGPHPRLHQPLGREILDQAEARSGWPGPSAPFANRRSASVQTARALPELRASSGSHAGCNGHQPRASLQ